jgi:hypothetical protein
MREKRAERRVGILARVEVLWEDEAGTPRVAPAKLDDNSRGGASIRIKEQFSVGSKLTIQRDTEQFSGTVTYCHRHGLEYVLGIQRDPAVRQSPSPT